MYITWINKEKKITPLKSTNIGWNPINRINPASFLHFCRTQRVFLFQNLTLGYYINKNSESDYLFFPPPKSEYFFRKKTITPPSS
jgi:hypothetical protein